ncbi:hypothetical protein E7Z59_08210 [Robertkochia marina]|uniref:Uncharacterized protein n=1 Tax=Robertkochia marina TaxID=1227945 RepID=A0A4S3LZS7_9FLAO|nr:BfmA/BtgA family mobilization protein [Robertkochia marina]THD67632.1 hypothetical protein E7Z59_08210 [Robertkochia marina]TRZ43365.1 hypothetical protein D3A96_10350 [Robertkochia marina]
MNTYANIRAYKDIIDQFRDFAKHQGLMQSQALKFLLDHYHESEDQQPEVISNDHPIVQRIEETISIIRNIEKNQTKPILALLQLLFEEQPQNRPPSKHQDSNELSELENHCKLLHHQIQDLVRKIEPVSPPFSKSYFRIQLSDTEYEKLLNTFN